MQPNLVISIDYYYYYYYYYLLCTICYLLPVHGVLSEITMRSIYCFQITQLSLGMLIGGVLNTQVWQRHAGQGRRALRPGKIDYSNLFLQCSHYSLYLSPSHGSIRDLGTAAIGCKPCKSFNSGTSRIVSSAPLPPRHAGFIRYLETVTGGCEVHLSFSSGTSRITRSAPPSLFNYLLGHAGSIRDLETDLETSTRGYGHYRSLNSGTSRIKSSAPFSRSANTTQSDSTTARISLAKR